MTRRSYAEIAPTVATARPGSLFSPPGDFRPALDDSPAAAASPRLAGRPPCEQGLLLRPRPFLDRLVAGQLLEASVIDTFLEQRADRLAEYTTEERLGQALVQAGLLTAYQLE